MSNARVLPNNLEAERACLGAVLLRPEVLPELQVAARPEDFYSPANQQILQSMQRLAAAGKPIDVLTLGVDLQEHGHLSRVGGAEAIAELAGHVPTAQNVAHYARMVTSTAQLRRAIQAAAQLQAEAFDHPEDSEKLIQQGIDALQECFRHNPKVRHISEVVEEVRQQIEERSDAAWEGREDELPPLGIPSGIAQLDKQLTFGGVPVGHPSLIGADSSVGKSALANQWIRSATRYGPVLDCTLEDGAPSRVIRHVAAATGANNKSLQGYVVKRREDWDAVGLDLQELAATDIYYLEEIPDSVDDLCTQSQRVIQQFGCRLWVIDYAQLVPSGLKYGGVYEDSSHIMRTINRTARKLKDCATIIVSQFSQRQDPEQLPVLKDFFGAAEVVQKAHTAIALWRPALGKDPHSDKQYPAVWCDLLKQKNGPTGGFTLGWYKHSAAFYDCTDQRFRELLRRESWTSEAIRDLSEIYEKTVLRGKKQ